jgi:5-methylcytosine-specific restriction enzyme subunit McrC
MAWRKRLQVYQYQKLRYEELAPDSPDELERVENRSGVPVFSFFRDHLRTGRHVGLVQTSAETIEILPKIFEDRSENLGVFLLLLRLTGEVEIRPTGRAHLENRQGSLLEVWTHYFASELGALLKRQYQREYVEVERTSDFIRGRLLIEDIQAGREKLPGGYPCRHEVYTGDNLLNQTLKCCNRLLLHETRRQETRRLLELNEAFLKDVTDRPVTTSDLERIQINRLNEDYEPVLRLCRLILQSSSLDMRAGRIRQLAFTFDMAGLFERAVAHLVQKFQSHLRLGGRPVTSVRTQSKLGRVFGEHLMQVDLELEDDQGRRTLIDTKYKAAGASRSHHGVSREDFYQMYSYARAGTRDCDEVVLLYPSRKPIRRRFEAPEATLYVRSIDLRALGNPADGTLARGQATEALNAALEGIGSGAEE